MKRIFAYDEPDRRALILTLVYLGLFVTVSLVLWLVSGWTLYTRAMLFAILVALVILPVLSIPRKIEITENHVDISCLVELTRIPVREIRSVRRLEKSEMKREIPVLGSYGLWGYYGYYLDLGTLRISALYCSTWDNFVEITDDSEKRYVVSCPQPDLFVAAVTEAIHAESSR